MDQRTRTAYHEILSHIRQIWTRERSRERRLSTILISIGACGCVALYGAVSLFLWSPLGVGFLAACGVSGLMLITGVSLASYSTTVLSPPLRDHLLEETITFLRERAYEDTTLEWVMDRAFDMWVDLRMPTSMRARHYIMLEAIRQVRPAPEIDPKHQTARAATCPHCGSMLALTIVDGTPVSS